MKGGAERIRNIVLSLRNFARHDEADMKPVDIHEGIQSTLMILQPRLRCEGEQRGIEVIEDYAILPRVTCYASELNQVFMNILSNAIYALEKDEHTAKPRIQIRTELSSRNSAIVRIADNGPGMSDEVLRRIFDPFFTTKPVGSGTGLGLSISYQIVVEAHGGELTCTSAPGNGTEFAIEIPLQPRTRFS
jgi:signal transduction histidine kinase